MTRNRFNKAKQQSENQFLVSAITNTLTTNKACQSFLEDNDNIDMKDTYKITTMHPSIDEKGVVNKKYCDNYLISSSNKIDIFSKNKTELKLQLKDYK